MAKRSKCPSCGSNFLKGRYVLRITTDGAQRQRVCQSCASLASLVLATDAAARCQNGQCKRLAAYCAGCIGKVLEEQSGLNIVGQLAKRANKRRRKPKS